MNIVQRFENGGLNVYQRLISRDLGEERHARCLYLPSCSEYMKEAVQEDGAWLGVSRGLMRLARCSHPVAGVRRQEIRGLFTGSRENLEQSAHFATDGARKSALALLGIAEQIKALPEGSERQGLQSRFKDEFSKLQVRAEDAPDASPDRQMTYLVSDAPICEHDNWIAHKEHGLLGRAAIQTAGVLAGGAGAIVGGVAGLLAGAAVGASFGVLAGTGRTDQINSWLTARFGGDSVLGLSNVERTVGKVPYQVREHAGSLVGGPVGFLLGGAIGAAAGVLTAAQGWTYARLAGQNAVELGLS